MSTVNVKEKKKFNILCLQLKKIQLKHEKKDCF